MAHKTPRQWRPKVAELINAEELLHGLSTAWAGQRLRLVSLLGQKPPLHRHEIAKKLDVRTAWVNRILEKWQQFGVESVAVYRQGELTLAELAWFRKKIKRGNIKTKGDFAAEIFTKKGTSLSPPCLRGYCRKLNLSSPSQSSIPEACKHPNLEAYKWSESQLAELSAYSGPNPERIQALLRLGREFCSVREAARRCNAERSDSRESNLRSDLRRYLAGGLPAVVNTWLRTRQKRREKREAEFNTLCNNHLAIHGTCPTVVEARAFLDSVGTVLNPSAAYRYLAEWKSKNEFESRPYKWRD